MIKTFRRVLVSLLVYFTAINCYAQYSDSAAYYAGLSSTGTFNQAGENSSYLINNGIKFGARKKSISLNSNNKWLYGKQNNELTNNDFSSTWDANLYKTFPHFYYWGLFVYNTAYSLKINNQLQAGLGIAYKLIDKKTREFTISDGLLYEYSDVNLSDTVREVYGTPRNSLRLQLKWNIMERLIFSGNGFLQNSLTNNHDYIIKTDLSLSIKIRKWLSVGSTCSYNKMTRTNSENLFITYGVTIEKYF